MRKYLQIIVVLAIFLSAVLVRQLREPVRQPFPAEGPASAIGSPASISPSPSPQSTDTETLAPTEAIPIPQPTPASATAPMVIVAPTTGQANEVTSTPTAAADPTPSPTVTKWPYLFEGSVFKDGAFTGKPSRMNYGDLQVTVVMQSGRIEDVVIVEFPVRTPTSENMSREILPRLVAEAIAKQDWDVDTISGATQTTIAFQRAMVYALRQSEQG